jgi:hemerythrin-like domain-containing protein
MPGTGNPYADTRAMFMIHSMFRREFALLPSLIGAVPPQDGQRVQAVADHVGLMCSLLHHHHSAEDDVLWPLLLARAPKEIDPVVRLAEGHHRAIDELLSEVGKRLEAWRDGPTATDGAALALALRRLAATAFEHMGLEERLVLPLVERHIFATEWEAMEQQAVASMALEEAVLAVGMVMYEVDKEELPAVFPEEILDVAPQAYAAHAERVHGTKTPPRSVELAIGTPLVGVASEVARG